MAYTHEQMLEKMQVASQEMNTFYLQAFINYQGNEKGIGKAKGLAYGEDIADYLLNNLSLFDSIPVITRTLCYKTKGHDGITENPDSNRAEERIALGMFGNEYENIGKIIDYQTPLKNAHADKHIGKIDLLTETENEIWLVEVKKYDSEETLLRCILEAYTNFKTVDADKLKLDFELDQQKPLRCAAIVFRDQEQHESYQKPNSSVRRLMDTLDIHLFVIAKENKEYLVDKA